MMEHEDYPELPRDLAAIILGSQFARYDSPELRFDLSAWLRNPGPNGKRYWRWDAHMQCVVLHLRTPAFEVDTIEADEIGIPRIVRKRVDGWHVMQPVSLTELQTIKLGWRICIAMHLRRMRKFLNGRRRS